MPPNPEVANADNATELAWFSVYCSTVWLMLCRGKPGGIHSALRPINSHLTGRGVITSPRPGRVPGIPEPV
jgi:hypothetical protein